MTVTKAVKVASAVKAHAACEATLRKRAHAAAAIAALNAESVDFDVALQRNGDAITLERAAIVQQIANLQRTRVSAQAMADFR